ncbi:Phosphoinositide 3-kinase regulatory subunit 4 [Eumeta japonica]|uniref:non-specific serine/threonine protein kinase n=1 Tax=Eumeta variegata TaxID=151549 RepID=A0A4C1WSR5_EUMVA|nr:Phosphoinositide 3-kinase regulatory subunit 4 [Eumeta japonica]
MSSGISIESDTGCRNESQEIGFYIENRTGVEIEFKEGIRIKKYNFTKTMGNQLVGVAPSQIYPVEHYLSDHSDLSFDQSLGSTRFLKVARARSREGLVVVKVFAVQDPSLPLAEHKDQILKIRHQLASAFNCLPFQRVILTDKAGLLMREYCKCSVYDRMSTRPFLTQLEKKWITFQVLYALHCCHKLGICHGDIKLENIMVTSWLWVLLTDIASFKPTFLPDDNPADFSYFFDTSRRRLCYVAPERFIRAPDPHHKSSGDDKSGGGLLLSESPCKVGELQPSMDIFSAGCALLELWNDGTPALDLPGLLSYRNGEERPSTMTVNGGETRLKDLLHSMTERNPKDRLSAELYLDNERGKLFPEYFYSFLQSYMLIFSAQPILPPDEKILRIHQDIKNIIKIFTQPSDMKNYKDLVEETTETQNIENINDLMKEGFKVMNVKVAEVEEEFNMKGSVKKEFGPDNEGLILITSLVTSCIRGLHHCTSKLYSLEILQLLCENSSSDTILDRILPYIIHLIHDNVSRVRVAALYVLTRCVALIDALPKSDSNVFPEYIFPEIAPRATDTSVAVRIAYANNIAKLAETAVRFLDQTQNVAGAEATNLNYESELSALHEMVRSTVSSLLTDPQAVVKRALVENGITKLCVFFGKQKANDVILSHMVTFLNDKEEAALRGSFFDSAVGVCAYVGQHCAPILLPLLQQGLTDQSEWIIAKALRATANLAELGLLQKQALCDLVAESSPYLAHPNLWIRHEVCGLVSCVSSLLNPIDVNCKILPLVWPHLKHKLIQVERAELLLESLADPVPRNVLDAVLRHRDVDRLVHTLRERRNTRLKVKQGMMPQYSEMGQQLHNLFRRLASDGMTEHVENQLLAMSAHLIKIQRTATQQVNEAPGRLILHRTNTSRSVQLGPGALDTTTAHADSRRVHKTSGPHETHMNSEWQHMFGQAQDVQHSTRESSQSISGSASGATAAAPVVVPAHSILSHSGTVHESYVQCKKEINLSQDPCVDGKEQVSLPVSWRPGGQLLAYLHEHRARVNRLVPLAQRGYFGSCSDDGTVRLWDAQRLEGNAYVNKSRAIYNRGAGPVVALAPCENDQSFVAATQEGSIFVLRMESGSSRMSLSQCRQLEVSEEGCAVDVWCAGGAHGGVISYATLYATIVGWDLRAPGNAWRLQGDLKQGVYTCLYADPSGYLAVGTSSGTICVWDLRFQLPITTIHHPNSGARIRRIVCWGGGSRVWACGGRDAGAWCLESTQRTHALWPHTNPHQPLTYAHPAPHQVTSIYWGRHGGEESGNGFVLTGGSDLRVRYWDVARPDDSYVVLHAPNDHLKANVNALKYRSRIIDGTTVVQECCKVPSTIPTSIEESIYRSVESRHHYHTAPVTDLTLVQGTKPYLVTSSADGVVNVWK